MKITRNINTKLKEWKNKSNRKPLIIRGARQVGKTTVVKMFAKNFKHFIDLNLEKEKHKNYFLDAGDVDEFLSKIFFENNVENNSKDTLIFIDEIQEVPKALNWLRFFYEDYPNIYVIAAGSLLETILNKQVSFPVGRVEYLVLRPFSFEEFLIALNEKNVLKAYHTIPFPDYAFDKTMELFHTYTLIGGMPEIVVNYVKNKDLVFLENTYASLITSYIDDVEKYAKSNSLLQVLRISIEVAFKEAGNRIKFEKFGNTNYKSREIGEALRTLEKTFILSLVYPIVNFGFPLLTNYRKSPKLMVFDTGLLNYVAGFQKDLFHTKNLHNNQKGKIAEHIVGQEIMATNYSPLSKLLFWVRDKNNADAEIDFLIPYKDKIIPIEVKSGATGSLRSLHFYMENAKAPFAIRLFAGKSSNQLVNVKNIQAYTLYNLPYFLAGKLPDYINYFCKQNK